MNAYKWYCIFLYHPCLRGLCDPIALGELQEYV